MQHRQWETLARIDLFDGLDSTEIGRLDTQCIWRGFDAGTEILSHHGTSTDIYFVSAGTVRVIIASLRGRDTIFRDIDAGEYFGELAAVDGRERSASIVALTNATVAKMPAAVFRDLAMRHGAICFRVLEGAVAQIRYLSSRINEFRALDVRHRIYAELIRMARPAAPESKEAVISPPPLHQEIADRISSRREAVARELKSLERDGLLTRRRGAMVITDVIELNERVEEGFDGTE